MKTFIWNDDTQNEREIFVALAKSVEEARSIICKKIKEQRPIPYNLKEDLEHINTSEPIIINENTGYIGTHLNY